MLLSLRLVLVYAAVATATAGTIADAQTSTVPARVRVRSAEGSPVRGALVGLVDAGGRIAVEGLSNEDGARLLMAPPGTYRVQVRRIGYQPFMSGEFGLPRVFRSNVN